MEMPVSDTEIHRNDLEADEPDLSVVAESIADDLGSEDIA